MNKEQFEGSWKQFKGELKKMGPIYGQRSP